MKRRTFRQWWLLIFVWVSGLYFALIAAIATYIGFAFTARDGWRAFFNMFGGARPFPPHPLMLLMALSAAVAYVVKGAGAWLDKRGLSELSTSAADVAASQAGPPHPR